MKRTAISALILQEKLIAIIRVKAADKVPVILAGLVAGGVRVLEITSNSPEFEGLIRENRKRYPDILIGAGTITNRSLAFKAVDAGAQFLVSPNMNPAVIPVAHDHDIPVVMGALTPTEVGEAVENDADFVKLFPAGNFGPDYLKAIKAPFDETRFFAVGGIHLETMEDWLEAGAVGVGLGSVLTNFGGAKLSEEIVAHNASKYVEKIKKYESGAKN